MHLSSRSFLGHQLSLTHALFLLAITCALKWLLAGNSKHESSASLFCRWSEQNRQRVLDPPIPCLQSLSNCHGFPHLGGLPQPRLQNTSELAQERCKYIGNLIPCDLLVIYLLYSIILLTDKSHASASLIFIRIDFIRIYFCSK